MTFKVLLSQHDLNSAATGGSSGYVLTRDFLLMQPNPCGRPQAWIDGPIGSERFGFSATGFYVSKFPYETHYSHFCQGWEASSESGCIVGIADLLPPTSRGTPHNGRSQYSKGLEKKTETLKAAFCEGLAQLRNLMEASLKTALEEGTSLEGLSSRNLSLSSISYLDKIIITVYELSG